MKRISEKDALKQAVEELEKLVGGNAQQVDYKPEAKLPGKGYAPDLVVDVGGFRFVVEYKSSPLVAATVSGIEQLKRYSGDSSAIRLLVTPFMGETGIRKCAEAGVSWLDLSGNADVTAPGLRLYVRGEKNKFISSGRNENPFAPKSSRIARHLLYHPDRRWRQRELAEEAKLGEGFVSRIVKSLEAQQLVSRDTDGKLFVSKPLLMLEAWQQGYDFMKHEIVRGHVAGRSGEEIQAKISQSFKAHSVEHAATGLGAAWLYSRFAAFRTVSFYLKDWPDNELLEKIGFRADTAGANTWLILPKDSDLFHGAQPAGRCRRKSGCLSVFGNAGQKFSEGVDFCPAHGHFRCGDAYPAIFPLVLCQLKCGNCHRHRHWDHPQFYGRRRFHPGHRSLGFSLSDARKVSHG